MKFKYQLRGFALGVVITVVIMSAIQRENQSNEMGDIPNDSSIMETEEESANGFSQNDSTTSSGNALIDYQNGKDNAQPLQVESDLLINSNVEEDTIEEESTEDTLEEESVEETLEEESVEETMEEVVLDSVIVGEETVLELDLRVNDSLISKNTEEVVLAIVSGDSSYTVSRKLFELGVVEDVVDFDLYLCTNGYDKKIRVGVYTIEPSISYEYLSKIISSQ